MFFRKFQASVRHYNKGDMNNYIPCVKLYYDISLSGLISFLFMVTDNIHFLSGNINILTDNIDILTENILTDNMAWHNLAPSRK